MVAPASGQGRSPIIAGGTPMPSVAAALAPRAAAGASETPAPASAEKALAQQILQATGVRGGLVVHVGCGDGRLTAALHAGDAYLVHGLDADAANVEKARAHIWSLGLYGPVSVEQWTDAAHLPYANNLVNLLVISDSGMQISEHKIPEAEILRALAPLGAAYVKGKDGQWAKTVKPWPQEIDEWTHYLHGPDGNAVARDRVVGPPARVQWVEGPLWQRHHEMNANPNAMVSAKGRLFYINDEAPATVAGMPDRWELVARDAFNGVLLWKRPVPDWGWKAWSTVETGGRFNLPLHAPRRMVAVGDRVFVTLGFNAPLTALDAATGKTVKTYDGTEYADEILVDEGLLILSVNQAPQKPDTVEQRRGKKGQAKPEQAPQQPGPIGEPPAVKKRVMVLKADTGEIVWTRGPFTGVSSSPMSGHLEHITRLLTAVGGGKVLCADTEAVIALDLKTGRELWRTPRPELPPHPAKLRENPPNFCTLVIHQDTALFLQTEESYDTNTWNRGVHCKLTGLTLDTGKVLWTLPCSKWGPGSEGDLFVINDLAWTHDAAGYAMIGIDLHTGQVKRTVDATEAFDEVHHHRCFRDKATENFILAGRRGIETIDLAQGKITKNEWVRGACRYGIMPANGLIYAPPHPCQCYIDVKLNGFWALAAAQATEAGRPEAPAAGRLERGPAYEAVSNLKSPESPAPGPSAWPTYRHDPRRSGATGTPVPGALAPCWQADLGGSLSACTAAGGKVFVAQADEQRVVALDAVTGKAVWSYTAGGRVDTPPTLFKGLAIFGSADGWVYGLRAADGRLAWRFRAAPQERRIVAMGRLESAWPVHGTVLVEGGVAYVAAGRSTHLDGGIKVYALRPETGELVRELAPLNANPEGLEDVLVSDGNRVYMRQLEFSLREAPGAEPRRGKAAPSAARAFSTAGLLDDSYFSRVGWGGGGKGGQSELLVFDETSTYAFRIRRSGGFGGWFTPGTGADELVALDGSPGKPRWSAKVPLRVRAMAVAGPTLFVAGPPDVAEPSDPWATLEGRKGAVLWAINKADGKKTAEYKIASGPVFDGLIAAGGRLYLSTLDGKVMCLGGEP
jgi:outer membrane protein assembly factor BamB